MLPFFLDAQDVWLLSAYPCGHLYAAYLFQNSLGTMISLKELENSVQQMQEQNPDGEMRIIIDLESVAMCGAKCRHHPDFTLTRS